LAASLCTSTHVGPDPVQHIDEPPPHWQEPLTQLASAGQRLPHQPQLLLSLCRSAQTSAPVGISTHKVSAPPSIASVPHWQEPFRHVPVAGHWRPHPPQLSGSLDRSTDALPLGVSDLRSHHRSSARSGRAIGSPRSTAPSPASCPGSRNRRWPRQTHFASCCSSACRW
jgi:hypothetical protein